MDLERLSSRTKRRKVEKNPKVESTFLFRLVSSSLPPLPISLLPPPPPPSVFREPDAEDDKMQALVRKQRSEVVAVDGTSVLLESKLHKQKDSVIDTEEQAKVQVLTAAPPMIVIVKQQPSRKTRPPVPSSELIYHPYASRAPTNPTDLPKVKIPLVDLESNKSELKSSRRQRRKRLREGTRQRPFPRFWRPESSWSGPCKGYAFGYPNSIAGGLEKGYQRDEMKKAILPSSQIQYEQTLFLH